MKYRYKNIIIFVFLVSSLLISDNLILFSKIKNNSIIEHPPYRKKLNTSANNYYFLDGITQVGYSFDVRNKCYILTKLNGTDFTTFELDSQLYEVNYGLNIIPIDFGNSSALHSLIFEQDDVDNQNFEWFSIQSLIIEENEIIVSLDDDYTTSFFATGTIAVMVQPSFSYNWLFLELDGNVINDFYDPNYYPEIDSTLFSYFIEDGSYLSFIFHLDPKEHILKLKGNGSLSYKVISNFDWDGDLISDMEEFQKSLFYDNLDPTTPNIWGYFEKSSKISQVSNTSILGSGNFYFYIPESYDGSQYLYLYAKRGTISEIVVDGDYLTLKGVVLSEEDKITPYGYLAKGDHSVDYHYWINQTTEILVQIGGREVLVLDKPEYKDSDGDGVKDIQERKKGSDTMLCDTDFDGIPDNFDLSPLASMNLAKDEHHYFEIPANIEKNTAITIRIKKPEHDYTTLKERVYLNNHSHGPGINVTIYPVIEIYGNSTGVGDPVPDLENLNASSIFSYAKIANKTFEFNFNYEKGHPAKIDGEIDLHIYFRWLVLYNNSGTTVFLRTYDFEQDILVQSITIEELGEANYILGTPDSMIENQILWALVQNPTLGTPADYNVSDDILGMGTIDYLKIANQSCIDYNNAQLNENQSVVLYVAGEQNNFDLLNKISLQSIINPTFEMNYSGIFSSYLTFCSIYDPNKNDTYFQNFLNKPCYEIVWKNLSTENTFHHEQRVNIQSFPIKMETFVIHNSKVLKLTQAIGNDVPLTEIPYNLSSSITEKIAFLNQTFLEPIDIDSISPQLFYNKSKHYFYESLDTHQLQVEISEKIFEAEDIPLSERFTNFLDQLRNANNELDNILNLNPELGITLDTQILWEVEINLPDRLLGIDTYIEFLDTMPENLDAFQFVRDMYEKVNDVNDFVDGIKGLIEPFNYIKKLESFATTEFEFSCWFQRTEAFTASVSIFFGFYCLFEEIYNIYSLLSNDINYSSSSFALKLTIAIGKTVVAGLAIASGGIQILLTVSGYALSETLLAMSEVLPVVGIVLTFSVKFLDAIDNINDAWEEGGLNAGIKQAWIEVLDLVFPILSFDIMKTLAETGKLELMCWYLITPMFADLIISLFLEQPVASQIQIIPSYDVIWEDAEGYPLSYINFPIRNTWIGNSLTLGDVLEFKITFLNNGTVPLWLQSYVGIPEADGTLDYGLPYFTTWVNPDETDVIHQYKGIGETSPNLKIMWKLEIFTMVGPDMVLVYDNETEIILNKPVCPKKISDFYSLTDKIVKSVESVQNYIISIIDHSLIELDPIVGEAAVNLTLDIVGYDDSLITVNITCNNANFYVDSPTIVQNLYSDITFNLYSQSLDYLGGIYYFAIEIINGTGTTIFFESVPFRLSFLRDLVYTQANIIYKDNINKLYYHNNLSIPNYVPVTEVGFGNVLFLTYITNCSKSLAITLSLDTQNITTYFIKSRGHLDYPQQFVEILIDKDFSFNNFFFEGDLSNEDYLLIMDFVLIDGSVKYPNNIIFNPINFTNNGNVPEFIRFSFSGIPFEAVDTSLYQNEFAGKYQYALITEGDMRVCWFNISNPVKATSNLYYRSIMASDPISKHIFGKHIDSLEIDGIYLNNPLNTTYYQYARNDTLYISIISHEDLGLSSYKLDNNTLVNFSHSVHIPMPQEGTHQIQIFGENSLNELFESEIRYFTIKSKLIDIKSPLSEFYPIPNTGYIFNASYGFDYDLNGSKPFGLDSSENVEIINYMDNHIKVVELNSLNGSISCKNEFPRAFGTVELWIRFGDVENNIQSIKFRDTITNELLIMIRVSDSEWGYYPSSHIYQQVPNVPIPQNYKWYHLKIDFRCNGSPSYLGLSEESYVLTIDGISSGELEFYNRGLNDCGIFEVSTSEYLSGDGNLWIDAIGLSWDTNYNIGNNLAGIEYSIIPLIYESDIYFKSIYYCIDGYNIMPLLTKDLVLFTEKGNRTYELYGIDIYENLYESNLINLAVGEVHLFTRSGNNVFIYDHFTGISFNFSTIITEGITIISLKTNDSVPILPSTIEIGYQDYPVHILSTYFYEISTTAEMSGFVTVTFPYLESRVQRNERNVQLFQYGYSSWYNITQDIYLNQNEITCRVSSFSYFTIIEILDYISPITEVLLNGSYAQQVNELTNDVLIEIYAYDDFPGTKSFYSLDGITWILYNNPFILSIEGYYHFQVYSIDTSNNSLLPYWYDILIDRLPPITTIVIEPLKVDSSGNLHYFAESTLSFIVNDTSTYYITYFRIENTFYNDWEIYYDPIELPDSGTLRIEYYSIDSVGHEEEIHTITISLENPNIDFLPIIIGSSIAGLAGVVVLFTILFLKKRRHNSLIES